MKMFFRFGKFREGADSEKFDGLNSVCWTPGSSAEEYTIFPKSMHEVTMTSYKFDIFRFRDICGQEIYGIYKKDHVDSKELFYEALEEISDNNVDDVVNYEDAMIYEAWNKINISANKDRELYIEDTIFWDLLNHFIIVIGRENLKNLVWAIEMEAWRDLAPLVGLSLREYSNSIKDKMGKDEFSLIRKAQRI